MYTYCIVEGYVSKPNKSGIFKAVDFDAAIRKAKSYADKGFYTSYEHRGTLFLIHDDGSYGLAGFVLRDYNKMIFVGDLEAIKMTRAIANYRRSKKRI